MFASGSFRKFGTPGTLGTGHRLSREQKIFNLGLYSAGQWIKISVTMMNSTEIQSDSNRPPQPKHALRMEYRLVVTGAGQTPVDIEGVVDLPMAFRPGTGMNGSETFDKMFDLFLRDPASSSVAEVYRELFESEMKAQHAQRAWLSPDQPSQAGGLPPTAPMPAFPAAAMPSELSAVG